LNFYGGKIRKKEILKKDLTNNNQRDIIEKNEGHAFYNKAECSVLTLAQWCPGLIKM
jgi:hypothetical protein